MKNKGLIQLVLSFFVLATLLGSCSKPLDVADKSEIVFLEEEALEGEPTPTFINASSVISNIKFSADPVTRKEGTYTGKELILETVDESGKTWTLTIPPDALESNQTIAMTAITDITDDIGLALSGVLLEPDSLEFLVPATITVSGANPGTSLLVSTDHAGKDPRLTLSYNDNGQIVGMVNHFSTELTVEEIKNDPESRRILLEYSAMILKDAESLIDEDISIPKPPSIDLEDFKPILAHAKAQVYFEKNFKSMEAGYSAALMVAYSTYKEFYGPNSKQARRASYLCFRMNARLKKKIDAFVTKYSPQPEHFFVAWAIADAAKLAAIVDEVLNAIYIKKDVGNTENYEQSYLNRLSIWAENTIYYVITQVGKENNYDIYDSAYVLLYSIEESMKLRGVEVNKWRDRFVNAETFELSYDLYIRDKDFYIRVEGKCQAKPFEENVNGTDMYFRLKGESQVTYTDVKATFTTNEYVIEPKTFSSQCVLSFSDDVVIFGLSTIGSPDETHINKDKDGDYSMLNPVVERTFSIFYNGKYYSTSDMQYVFDVAYHINSSTVFDVKTSADQIDSVFHAELVHTPK